MIGQKKTFLSDNKNSQQHRHKLIIYLCEPSIHLLENIKIEITPQRFVFGEHWQNLYHIYIQLPIKHPFDLPKLNTGIICYNSESQQPNSELSQIINSGGLRNRGIYKNNLKHRPLVSIITVVKNGEKYLEQTIQSVINQTYENIEYIIIDGGSTDKTLDIIKNYDDRIDYWISEDDQGISDAFNKGVSLCSGDLVNILSSDDLYFHASTVKKIVDEVGDNLQTFFFGACFYISNKSISKIEGDQNYWHKINFYMPHINHPTVFINRSLLEKYPFSNEYKYCMDYHFFLRLTKQEIKGKALKEPITIIRTDGISNLFYYKTRKEVLKVSIELGTNKLLAFSIYIILILKFWIRQCMKF